ncbi:MAG: PASTA domain-containing protein [bacterium]
MLIELLTFYLIAIIIVSVILSYLLWNHKLPPLRKVATVFAALFILPVLIGYFYYIYLGSIPEVTIPDLVGFTLDEAMINLEALDLKGELAGSVFDMRLPEGQVVSQIPAAMRQVKVGRAVRLITSSGRQKASVPNLLGRPVDQAEAVLSAKGLLLGEVEQEFVAGMDAGLVLAQSPLPDEEVESSTEVNITITSSVEVSTVEKKTIQKETQENTQDKGGIWPWW